jgi:hypothetical protein
VPLNDHLSIDDMLTPQYEAMMADAIKKRLKENRSYVLTQGPTNSPGYAANSSPGFVGDPIPGNVTIYNDPYPPFGGLYDATQKRPPPNVGYPRTAAHTNNAAGGFSSGTNIPVATMSKALAPLHNNISNKFAVLMTLSDMGKVMGLEADDMWLMPTLGFRVNVCYSSVVYVPSPNGPILASMIVFRHEILTGGSPSSSAFMNFVYDGVMRDSSSGGSYKPDAWIDIANSEASNDPDRWEVLFAQYNLMLENRAKQDFLQNTICGVMNVSESLSMGTNAMPQHTCVPVIPVTYKMANADAPEFPKAFQEDIKREREKEDTEFSTVSPHLRRLIHGE